MNKYFRIPLIFISLFTLIACDESEQLDVEDIKIPKGYAMSAGTSTGFYNSSVAYDQAARWLSRKDILSPESPDPPRLTHDRPAKKLRSCTR